MTNKLALTDLANSANQYLNANATFAQLNQLVQAGVVDKDLFTPPASPANEALYIIATTSTPTGAWAGQGGKLAYWLGGSTNAWQFITPNEGFFVHVNDEDVYYKYTGTAWSVFSSGGGSFTGGTLTSALNEAPPPTIASSATPAIGAAAANSVFVSGTTTITAFDTISQGAVRRVIFTGALTLTHNGTSLVLPTAANITTAAGDSAEFLSLGSGNWRCAWYQRANGQALASVGGGFTGGTLSSAINEAPAVSIASAATVNIGAASANTVSITGTTTVTAFDTIAAGAKRTIVFAGALTLTHNATSLILPGAASITTAAGDVAEFLSLGSGNWRCIGYERASGRALVSSSSSATISAEHTKPSRIVSFNDAVMDLPTPGVVLQRGTPTVSVVGSAGAKNLSVASIYTSTTNGVYLSHITNEGRITFQVKKSPWLLGFRVSADGTGWHVWSNTDGLSLGVGYLNATGSVSYALLSGTGTAIPGSSGDLLNVEIDCGPVAPGIPIGVRIWVDGTARPSSYLWSGTFPADATGGSVPFNEGRVRLASYTSTALELRSASFLDGANGSAPVSAQASFVGRWFPRFEQGRLVMSSVRCGTAFRFRVSGATSVSARFVRSIGSSVSPRVAVYATESGGTLSRISFVDLGEGNADEVYRLLSGLSSASQYDVEVRVAGVLETDSKWRFGCGVQVAGLYAGSTGAISPWPDDRPRMMVIGDSISDGASAKTGGANTVLNSAGDESYSVLTANALGFAVNNCSFGGVGLLVAGSGSWPAVPTSLPYYMRDRLVREESPEYILINLGTNDSAASGTFQAAYITLIEQCRTLYPQARIIALIPFAQNYASAITAAASATGVSLITTSGWLVSGDYTDSVHPTVAGHVKIAGLLAPALRTLFAADYVLPTYIVGSLLHMDGPVGSTTFPDEVGNVWTPTGGAVITAGESDVGTAVTFGTGRYLSTPSFSAANFGSGDFTLEASFVLTAYSSSYTGSYFATVFGKHGTSSAAEFQLLLSGTASSWTGFTLQGYPIAGEGSQVTASAAFAFALNTIYRIRVCRSGNTAYFFVNGTLVGTAAFSVDLKVTSEPLYLGALNNPTYRFYFPGRMWETRIIKGSALSTTDYTVQTRFPYP